MNMRKLILTAASGLFFAVSAANAGGGGGDDLRYFCSSSELKYSVLIDIEDSPIFIGKEASILGEAVSYKRGYVKDHSSLRLLISTSPIDSSHRIEIEILFNSEIDIATKMIVTDGSHTDETNSVGCYVL